ncbi:transporter substrate-binding domain-containing protein [Vibrio sp. ZSDE26]|uniref:Transporter substrate-binding domain-containing protein n=1 Tax=Vibrio amylolyticus TaxID=2847292 RepID=A0A9X1XLU5_9VIBR|nr:HD domain-containing phosphohydrolase [Vibrio amylolyticus]MCK6265169.1 transporter substrate-binding domain-containing protein [Vibrio amylolyticus]
MVNKTKRRAKKYSIRFTVGSMFVLATILTSICAISIQYHFSRQMSEELVLTKLSMTSSKVSEHIEKVDSSASNVARLLKNISLVTEYQFSEHEVTTIFTQALKDNPMFYSIYWGNSQDDFFQIINLNSSPIVREKINAGEQDRWVVIRIEGPKNNRVRKTFYYTKEFERTNLIVESSNYYPTQRPWYHEANSQNVFKTEPYLFQHLKIAGQTYAVKTHTAVIGIDIVLSSVSELISPTALGLGEFKNVESFLFNQQGEIIATSLKRSEEVEVPPSNPLKLDANKQQMLKNARSLLVSNQNDWGPLDYSSAGQPKGYAVDLMKLISDMTGLRFEFVNGFDWYELQDMYHLGDIDILQSVSMTDRDDEIISKSLFNVPLGFATTVDIQSVDPLRAGPIALIRGRSTDKLIGQTESSFFRYANSLDEAMTWLSKGKVATVVDTLPVLQKYKAEHYLKELTLSEFGKPIKADYHLSMKNKDRFLSQVVDIAIDNVSDEQWKALNAKWLQDLSKSDSFVPYARVVELANQGALLGQMSKQIIDGTTRYLYITRMDTTNTESEYFAVVVPEQVIYAQVIPKVLVTIGFSVLVLLGLLPLAWVFGNPIVSPVRLLIKENHKVSKRKFDEVHHVKSRIKEVSDLSDSMVDMVEEIKNHQRAQEEFVEAFIRLIAQAIDEKSPYTAGHCNRVPKIGMLLASAAEQADYGKFKDFKFENEHERKEFQIAAWLHDCGKITTPEHIVDKGSKLEANYNRIHEIRTRFEVLWRDAEIDYLKQRYIEKLPEEQAQEVLTSTQAQLQEEFRFIAESNVGSEFMSADCIERIKEIGSKEWLRHFDNTLGLSPFEELALEAQSSVTPKSEPLLQDRPEHIIKRIRPLKFEPELGINIDVPKHLYNLGEVYNLSVTRGTLTTEDRFKINEHMTSGIKMLNNLPFPPELSRVPRYASTHHETLKGTGYPRKLTGEQLSIPERILAIADVYEALTAADRPYKKAKPVSVAIDIMHKMALDDHLDIDIFRLFLESGVYIQYAKEHLPASQIDMVDITKYRPVSESVSDTKVTQDKPLEMA